MADTPRDPHTPDPSMSMPDGHVPASSGVPTSSVPTSRRAAREAAAREAAARAAAQAPAAATPHAAASAAPTAGAPQTPPTAYQTPSAAAQTPQTAYQAAPAPASPDAATRQTPIQPAPHSFAPVHPEAPRPAAPEAELPAGPRTGPFVLVLPSGPIPVVDAARTAAVSRAAAPAQFHSEVPEYPAMERDEYRPAAVATADRPQTHDDPFAQLLAGDDHAPADVQWITPVPKRKRRRWVGLTITLIVIVALVAGGVWAWNTYSPQLKGLFGTEAPADYAAGKAHGEAPITVNAGDIPSTISNTLYKAGVTKSPTVFYQMLLDKGLNPTFYPGVYKLQKQMTASAALKAMEDPKNKLDHSVVLPEGLTESQILERTSKGLDIPLAELKAAAKHPKDYGVNQSSLEGWLFPALYQFNPGTSAHDVIKTMVDRMKRELSDAGVKASDQQKILTIASIVQREARQSQDFGKVARVIDNRLAQGMKLQMDSTAQYGYGSLHNGTASSSQAALDDPNPWNTYKHTGLPKTPISSPGSLAIDAALHPTKGTWLYFTTVNMDTGENVFSTTYAEQGKAVKQMQAWCSAHPDSGC